MPDLIELSTGLAIDHFEKYVASGGGGGGGVY